MLESGTRDAPVQMNRTHAPASFYTSTIASFKKTKSKILSFVCIYFAAKSYFDVHNFNNSECKSSSRRPRVYRCPKDFKMFVDIVKQW